MRVSSKVIGTTTAIPPPRRARGFVPLRFVICAAWFGLACSASTGPDPGPAPAAVGAAELLDAAGLDAHFRALRDAMVSAADRASADLSPERAVRLQGAARSCAASDELVTAAESRLVGPDHHAAMTRSLDFLRSPLGERMRDLEDRAEVGIDDATMSAFVDALFAEPVPLERIRTLERLRVATRGAELAAEVDAVAARVVARGASTLVEPTRNPGALETELARIEAHRRASVASWRAQASIFMQFVYRDATDEELVAYTEFAESDSGRWLVDATARTLSRLEPWLDDRLADALEEAR